MVEQEQSREAPLLDVLPMSAVETLGRCGAWRIRIPDAASRIGRQLKPADAEWA